MALIACTPAQTNLLTHVGFDGGPTGLLSARLVLDGSCLYADDSGQRWLLIWPQGYSLRDASVFAGDRAVGTLGARITVGGGEYESRHYDFLRAHMSSDVPEACRGGKFWLVTGVTG